MKQVLIWQNIHTFADLNALLIYTVFSVFLYDKLNKIKLHLSYVICFVCNPAISAIELKHLKHKRRFFFLLETTFGTFTIYIYSFVFEYVMSMGVILYLFYSIYLSMYLFYYKVSASNKIQNQRFKCTLKSIVSNIWGS